jgi:hypothetical protein
MKKIKNGNVYETCDLYLSSFLKAKGVKLIDKYKVKEKVQFVFEERDDRKSLIRDFFNNGSVGVTLFRSSLQDLKTILFNI